MADQPSRESKRRFLHIHWYRIVHDTGVHSYGECRCGHRKVYRHGGRHQPVHTTWLKGGPWERTIYPPPPPPKTRERRSDTAAVEPF